MRNPHRRFVRVLASSHEQGFLGLVADDLGRHFGNKGRGRSVWSDISRAVTTAGLEGYQVVLVVDRCDDALNPTVVRDLTSLLDCKSPGIPQGSLMIVGRHPSGSLSDIFDSWTPAIGLERLTRTQAATYLDTKLGAAGCRETVFTPRAHSAARIFSGRAPRNRADRDPGAHGRCPPEVRGGHARSCRSCRLAEAGCQKCFARAEITPTAGSSEAARARQPGWKRPRASDSINSLRDLMPRRVLPGPFSVELKASDE